MPGPACNRLLRSTLAVFIAEARKRITTKMHTRAKSDSSRGKRVVDNKFNSRTPATCLDHEQRLSCSQYRRQRPPRRLCWYPCCQRRSRQPQPSAGAEIYVTQRRLGTRYVRVHCFSLVQMKPINVHGAADVHVLAIRVQYTMCGRTTQPSIHTPQSFCEGRQPRHIATVQHVCQRS